MKRSGIAAVLALACALAGAAGPLAGLASGAEAGEAWRLEQPLPPELPDGQKSTIPIGLGMIGDIEFWAPNRGLLITAGNPPTIPAGVWAYNGVSWHELANVCGATEGRIAWAGPNEFWTVSDGRPGQAATEGNPPLADNTLCHFSGGQVVGSYASLAFRADSYQAMHGAACVGSEDCWFGGETLPAGQIGAFHLHWNGHSLSAEPNPQGHAVGDMRNYAGQLYESVHIEYGDEVSEPEPPTEPSLEHQIEPNGVQPTFVSLFTGLPIYAAGETPEALDFLRLSADEQALWGAADPTHAPKNSTLGEVTVLRDVGGTWTQVLGPTTDPGGTNPFTKAAGEPPSNEVVQSIAAAPPSPAEVVAGEEGAWLALNSRLNANKEPLAPAMVARLSSTGSVSERQTLPSAQETQEGVGPKGAAERIACPDVNDCWLATSQGWLFHLAPEGERHLPEDTDPAFSELITYRPEDEGIPKTVPDAPPPDDSGLLGEAPVALGTPPEKKETLPEPRIEVPLLSDVRTRLVKGTTLELLFHLAVRARVRLLAERHGKVVARTSMRTLAAGSRTLLLRLDRRQWPTKLKLETHALAALPTVATEGPAQTNTVSTSLRAFPREPLFSGLGSRG